MKTNKLIAYTSIFIILSIIGGMVEMFSYLSINMFAMMETGNIISLIYNIVSLNGLSFIYPLTSIILFIIETILISLIKKRAKNEVKYINISLFSLLLISFLHLFVFESNDELATNSFDIFKLLSVILTTSFGVILVFIFPKFNNINFVPVMMTNNIKIVSKMLGENEVKSEKIKFFSYLIVILSFILGAVISSLLYFYKDFIFKNTLTDYSINQNIVYLLIFILLFIVLILFNKNKELFIESEEK